MEREWHTTNSLRIVVCPAICRPNTHICKAAGFPDGRKIKEMSGCAARMAAAQPKPPLRGGRCLIDGCERNAHNLRAGGASWDPMRDDRKGSA
jgi:hypothetical protein